MSRDPAFTIPPAGGTFGEVLRRTRLDQSLTQTALADLTGVPQTRISSYEKDKIHFPDIADVEAIEQALNLPAGELVHRTGWARTGRHRRADDPRTVFIQHPSPTLRELMAIIAKLDESGHDRLLRYAQAMVG